MMAEENVAPGVAVVALLILSELASSATLKPVDHEDALDERGEQLGPQRRFMSGAPCASLSLQATLECVRSVGEN